MTGTPLSVPSPACRARCLPSSFGRHTVCHSAASRTQMPISAVLLPSSGPTTRGPGQESGRPS
eukprot:16451219-Heterocapsa_arctica.AAC.1